MVSEVYLRPEEVRETTEISDADRLEAESAIAHHEAQAKLTKEMGFEAQANTHLAFAEKAKKKFLPTPPFPAVSDEEYKIWRRFLPISYPRNRWSGYQFDLIPANVLETVRKYGHLFDALEIRTPEVMLSDPIIFGERDGQKYLVARWAESRIISFKEVVGEFLEKENLVMGFLRVLGFLFSVVLPIIATVISILSGWADTGEEITGIIILSSIFLIISLFFWIPWKNSRDKKKELNKMLALSA